MGSKPWYSMPQWRQVRRAVLLRDGFECQLKCARTCRGVADSADHRVRPEDGGALFDPANLQAACRPCNTAKRNRQLAERARVAELRAW